MHAYKMSQTTKRSPTEAQANMKKLNIESKSVKTNEPILRSDFAITLQVLKSFFVVVVVAIQVDVCDGAQTAWMAAITSFIMYEVHFPSLFGGNRIEKRQV